MPRNENKNVAMHHSEVTKVQALVRRLQYGNGAVYDTMMMCTRLRLERLLKLKTPTPDDIVWDEVHAACRNLDKERISLARFKSVIRTLLPYAFASKDAIFRPSEFESQVVA